MTVSLRSKGLMLILSSPSGGGKSSLTRALLTKEKDLQLSVSVTTRKPRANEMDGVDYYFKTEEEFEQLKESNILLEYAKIYDHYYGTPAEPIKRTLDLNIDILFDIDWQGARSIKQKVPSAVSVFILPPNIDTLKKRLELRNQDSLDEIERRLTEAQQIMNYASEYDYIVINDDFDKALDQIRSILIAERSKRERLDKLSNFLHS